MLKFEVKNQRLTRLDRFRAAEDSVNYLMAEFDILTDDWDGATITATFSNGEKTVDAVLIENRCIVPWEILVKLGKPVLAKVSLFGVKGDKIITTDICSFSLSSTLERGSSGKDPTPDAYQQIINMIEAGKVKGPQGDPGPQGPRGETGQTGPQGPIGETGQRGPQGEIGQTGQTGPAGQDGHTPVKGVDYWTASDKQEIYAEAEQALRDQEQSSVAAIRAAGADEVGKVQRKGTEVLESIPEDYSALTAEVGRLKSDLGYVKNVTVTEKYSTNLYNEANAEVGYRCTGSGETATAENSVLSEFIEIPDGATYAVPSAYYNGRYRVLCYSYGFADKSKKPIAGSGGNQTSAISIPDGAKYFRCSWLTTTTEQRFINFNTDGSLFTYEEYYEPIVSIKTAEDVTKKLNDHETRISDLENSIIGSEIKRVICWGDSLTDGSGSSDTKHQYPFVLRSLINANNTGIVTDSAGQGGEGTYSIATRQGGVVVNVKPCTVPASGSVNVEIDKWNGLTISLCRRGGKDVTTDNAKMKINPCYIAGVKGTLLRDSNSNYVFTRTEDGEEVTFTRPMPLLTDGHETYNGENEVAVIWSGTNDIASNGGTIEKTIQGINMMIAKLKSKKYIVVGLTSKAYHSDIDDKNFRMATEYKDNFINVRDYMLVYGLEDSGIEPTEQDLTDISNGEIPSSLRVDDVHGNDYFYDIVAKQVYKKGQELGYWN